jgi:small-conductance mechanosensitive channel
MDAILRYLSETNLLGMSLLDWHLLLGLSAGIAAGLIALKAALVKLLRDPGPSAGKTGLVVIVAMVHSTRPFFLAVMAVFVTEHFLALPPSPRVFFRYLGLIGMLYQAGHWVLALAGTFLRHQAEKKADRRAITFAAMPGIRVVLACIVWTLLGLVALDQIGVEVTALLTGLGIGGIAIALAIQKALGDLLAYVSIVADEPFRPGDELSIDDIRGIVQSVGLRSTRLISITGEQIVLPNSDVLAARIRNFGRMELRRAVLAFGVEYQTPSEKLEAIPQIVREIIEPMEGVRLDRVHFKSYGPYSLNFEAVYAVMSPELGRFMNVQQQVNLELLRRFTERDIRFAFPTQTLIMTGTGAGETVTAVPRPPDAAGAARA